jgi:hypothetical protein
MNFGWWNVLIIPFVFLYIHWYIRCDEEKQWRNQL